MVYGVLDFCVFLLAVTGGKMAIRAIPGRPIAKSTIHGLPYLSLVILFSIDASASHQPGIAPELTPKLRWVASRFRHGSVVPESWPVIINPLFHLFLFSSSSSTAVIHAPLKNNNVSLQVQPLLLHHQLLLPSLRRRQGRQRRCPGQGSRPGCSGQGSGVGR